jgi:hypothetical protein
MSPGRAKSPAGFLAVSGHHRLSQASLKGLRALQPLKSRPGIGGTGDRLLLAQNNRGFSVSQRAILRRGKSRGGAG